MTIKVACVYHKNCADGFASALIVKNHFLHKQVDVDFYPANYGERIPNELISTGYQRIYIVDFSYKEPEIREIAKYCGALIILDHHKSARENLDTLIKEIDRDDYTGNINIIFDMDRSGAGITWDYFNPGQPRPMLIYHVEDRDLWRFEDANTQNFQEYLFSQPYDFGIWNAIMRNAEKEDSYTSMIIQGAAIYRKKMKDIEELIASSAHWWRYTYPSGEEILIPAVNGPYFFSSEGGHLLLDLYESAPFVAFYWNTTTRDPNGILRTQFSLRARSKDAVDVSSIAKEYGGGGHKSAAGFTVDISQFDILGAPYMNTFSLKRSPI